MVAPSNPYDAKGLLIQAIRDDDPVIFAEHKMLYDVAGEVPEESYAIPFGEANIAREGGDVTIVAIGRMVNTALEAADELASSGIEVEIIDPRTTSPLDTDTILESVENTGRLVVVDESNPRCSLASDIAGLVAQEAFGALRAPIQQVTGPHTPVPFADSLEDLFIPDATRIAAQVVRGRKAVVPAMVSPGSGLVKRAAEAEGLDRIFRDAGFEWREAGCSMCIAMNGDQLQPGQYAVSTSNRNFEGRQGKGGRTFLASPLTAAATAINGVVTDVRTMLS